MVSQAQKRSAAKKKLQGELAATREAGLEGAQELSSEASAELDSRIAPSVRTDDTLVPQDVDRETDPDLVQPNLTEEGVSMRSVEEQFRQEFGTVEVEFGSGKKNAETIKTRVVPTAEVVEGLTDEQIEDSGLLDETHPIVHPARISPSSDRPRTPYQKEPAAGPGTWPVPEDALPAAMPSDPPREDSATAGSKTFADVSGIKVSRAKDSDEIEEITVSSTRAGNPIITIPRKQVAPAAHLWMQLRQQHPDLTKEQLLDEFYIQVEAMVGVVSPHGLTAAGDDRTSESEPGKDLETAVAKLVNENSEAELRQMAVDWTVPVEFVKADSDKPELARLILTRGRAPEGVEDPGFGVNGS